MSLEPTGFCWDCGRPITKGLFCIEKNGKAKCEHHYKWKQERQIKKGKRASYGVAGSMH